MLAHVGITGFESYQTFSQAAERVLESGDLDPNSHSSTYCLCDLYNLFNIFICEMGIIVVNTLFSSPESKVHSRDGHILFFSYHLDTLPNLSSQQIIFIY